MTLMTMAPSLVNLHYFRHMRKKIGDWNWIAQSSAMLRSQFGKLYRERRDMEGLCPKWFQYLWTDCHKTGIKPSACKRLKIKIQFVQESRFAASFYIVWEMMTFSVSPCLLHSDLTYCTPLPSSLDCPACYLPLSGTILLHQILSVPKICPLVFQNLNSRRLGNLDTGSLKLMKVWRPCTFLATCLC